MSDWINTLDNGGQSQKPYSGKIKAILPTGEVKYYEMKGGNVTVNKNSIDINESTLKRVFTKL